MKSMTGYGRAEYFDDRAKVRIELKSINNRYSDIQISLPQELRALEPVLRNIISTTVKRGRVDCSISVERYDEGVKTFRINKDLVKQFVAEFRELQKEFEIQDTLKSEMFLLVPGLVEIEKSYSEIPDWLVDIIQSTLYKSLSDLEGMRSSEGKRLREKILEGVRELQQIIMYIKNEADKIRPTLVDKYKARLKQVAYDVEMDQNRIAFEAAVAAERSDISEEIARLESHISELSGRIEKDSEEPVGKRFDFILQEMNREANTLNAKTSVLEINLRGVELKMEIEKMREQVQNIE